MLHFKEKIVRQHLFDGMMGIEKEGLRVTKDGFFAHTPHPFDPKDRFIVRDFCENQTEINTSPEPTAEEAYRELKYHTERVKETLKRMPEREYLWPFSNPPYIFNEDDIPIAQFEGEDHKKTEYREYLAMRYGRYKMTFSGIHFNYSFGDALLAEDFRLSGQDDFTGYKNGFYVALAAMAQFYNWLVVAVSAASPLLDSSYFEKGQYGNDVFNGMASSRCSDIGYWNFFTPLLDYTDLKSYTASIENIVEYDLIRSSSELYFPVRLKPSGEYSQYSLMENGANHIELRMIDLNPLDEAGMDIRDIKFLQLLLIYLACSEPESVDASVQVKAIANTKNAARYDLKTVNLVSDSGQKESIAAAAVRIIDEMRGFFRELDADVDEVLLFQRKKFTNIENRYSWKVRNLFSGGFVKKGMEYLKEMDG
ncbi:MAG: hypothetical protein K6G42_03020 [Lachnospiraceae bacterium]|nr:hypothetical protein [Lachnospiraceae bacterium]